MVASAQGLRDLWVLRTLGPHLRPCAPQLEEQAGLEQGTSSRQPWLPVCRRGEDTSVTEWRLQLSARV